MSNPNGLRIMLVDDEAFSRSTVMLMLRGIGQFDVREAGEGATALLLVTAFKPEIILCDIAMKPISGLVFVQQLRDLADQGLADTPVIMLTGHAEEAAINEAVKLRISSFLVKPVSAKRLAKSINAVVDNSLESGLGNS